ncbi:MAG: vWA domain-containing protein [Thermoguttaceae bacterium]|jgi:hypothetical protein
MAYTAEISRTNPTCFLFLVDQSGSMNEPFGSEAGRTKAEGVADAINRLLDALVRRCTKGVDVLDRYYLNVIGYGARIVFGFYGNLAGGVLRSVSEIANNPLRIEDRRKFAYDNTGRVVEQVSRFPVWFDPCAAGQTPMCGAFGVAQQMVADFVKRYPHCFPPVVINITDGAATDGDPEAAAALLRSAATSDGNVLLFNLHISSRGEGLVLFPNSEAGLPGANAPRLFRMSSPLPAAMLRQAQVLEVPVPEGARGFAFNADLVSLVTFLEIGTRAGPRPT